MRVLKWIIDRIHGRVYADRKPSGWSCRADRISTCKAWTTSPTMTSTNSWRLIAAAETREALSDGEFVLKLYVRCQRNSCSTANSSSCGRGAHRRCGSCAAVALLRLLIIQVRAVPRSPGGPGGLTTWLSALSDTFCLQMKQRGWGRLIQIGSGLASAPAATFAAYGSTKSAIVNLTVSHCQPPCQLHQLGQHPSGRRLRTDDELNTAPSTRRGTACGVVH